MATVLLLAGSACGAIREAERERWHALGRQRTAARQRMVAERFPGIPEARREAIAGRSLVPGMSSVEADTACTDKEVDKYSVAWFRAELRTVEVRRGGRVYLKGRFVVCTRQSAIRGRSPTKQPVTRMIGRIEDGIITHVYRSLAHAAVGRPFKSVPPCPTDGFWRLAQRHKVVKEPGDYCVTHSSHNQEPDYGLESRTGIPGPAMQR